MLALNIPLVASAQRNYRSEAAKVHVDQCIAYYNRGDLSRAIIELREAQRIVPKNPEINFMLGNALYRSGDFRAAANAYRTSLASRPSYFEGHMSLGFTLFELEQFQEAVAEWLEAKRLDPKEPFARAALAVGLYAIGRVEDANVQYVDAVVLDRRYGDPERLRIDVRWKPKALNIVKRLLEPPVRAMPFGAWGTNQ